MQTRRHLKFAKPREHYAERFGVVAGTVDFWIRRGKEHNDPPPLDEPDKLSAWWRRCMNGPVPERFQLQSKQALIERDFAGVRGLSMEDNVAALRVTLAINKQLLDEALATKEETTVGLRQRNYERCFNLLRLAEQSLTDLQKRRGELIEREKVIDDITKIVETLKLMRERMARDIITHIEQRCGRRMRRIMRQLKELLEPAIADVRASEEMIFARGFDDANTSAE